MSSSFLVPLLGFQPFSLPGLLAVLTLIIITSFIIKNTRSQAKKDLVKLPSPPNKLPIIGHLHLLGIHPHRNLQVVAKKHGDLMILQLGPAPTLVISSAKLAKEILKTHDHVFASRPHLDIAEKLFYGIKGIALTPYGEYWRQMRKVCILQLLSPTRVQSFHAVRGEEIMNVINKINRVASKGSVVDLSDILLSYTNDIICRVAFRRKYTGEASSAKFLQLVMDVTDLLGTFNIADLIPWLAFVNNFNGLNAKVERTVRAADKFLEGVVDEHIQRKLNRVNGGDGNEDHEDLVDVLLGIEKEASIGVTLTRNTIKAVILDMFVAGTDTSHTTLEWAMSELLRHPEAMKEAQDEIRKIVKGKPNITEDEIEEMHYLQAVIKETLRLHPPVALFLPHESLSEINLQGYHIPAKTRVLVNCWAIGRDPRSWNEPEKFEPKRFLNSPMDYKGHDFEFIPFGSGRRICPGATFATYTVRVGLANLLYRYDFTLPSTIEDLDMTESGPGLVIHKKSPLLVYAKDRLNS